MLGIIRNHVGRVNGIIHDVLDLSRRGKGQAERFSLAPYLNELCEQWTLRGYAGHRLNQACQSDVEVRFDRNQLTQVVDNLIRNAFQHGGEECKVELECGCHEQTGLPWLRIRDNGNGIPAETARHLFEPFYTTANDGNGLGLYLCRELCQANQAALDLEDTPNGASFVITFAHPHRQFQ